ncbi:MAG: hypothetical protein ABJN65_12085 [Parasphingorhabdus sp.]
MKFDRGLGVMKLGRSILLLLVGLFLPFGAAVQGSSSPQANELFTLSSADCVSVHADGEPWDECGFQSFAMSPNGSRVLTVSARGTIQLWNERGEELREVDWPDQPGGASGYPDARTLIFEQFAIAVVHQNQVVVLDLIDGDILAQTATDAMYIYELKPDAGLSVLVGFRLWDWRGRYAAELTLPDGQLREVEDLDNLRRTGPGYRISGKQAPFTLFRTAGDPVEIKLERSCMPINERFCSWRHIPSHTVHVLDIETGQWSDFDLGKTLTSQDSVEVIPAGESLFAVVCGRSISYFPSLKPCSVRNLRSGQAVHHFQASRYRTAGFVSSSGSSELRLTLQSGNDWNTITVSEDGTAYTLVANEAAWLGSPDGNLLVPQGAKKSVLTTVHGEELVHFPFPALTCGIGWPSWSTNCKIASDGSRWLVAKRPSSDSDDNAVSLTMYKVPIFHR